MSWHIRDLAWVLTFIVLGSTTMTLLFLANLSGLDLPGDINMDREADPGDPEIDDISLEPLRMRTSMYVGVMTAQVFLHTRATACNNTWGRYVPKLEFFCHLDEDGKEAAKDLPLIHMEDVDDTVYPPQKKVFRMLQHMCSHHLSKYDWFIRADDDVYLKVDKLTKLLHTLDKTKKLYIGQAGYGLIEDLPQLGLEGHSFCMGGPGVIFSRPALQALCPRLEQCLQEVVSEQEDVEIGRCVIKHLDMECTLAFEFEDLFYHAYLPEHYEDKPFTDDLSLDQHYQDAVAIHYAKEPYIMNNLHFYHTLDKIQRQRLILDYISERMALLELQPDEPDLEWGGLLTGGVMASATQQISFNKTHMAYGDCKQPLRGLEQDPWMQDALKEALQFVVSKSSTSLDMLSYEGTTSSCTSLGKDFILDLAFHKSNTTEVKHRNFQVLQKQVASGESDDFRIQTMSWITSSQSVVFIIPLLNGLQSSLTLSDYLKHVKVAFTESGSYCHSPPTVSIVFMTDGDGEESFRNAASPRDITPSATCGIHVYTWRPIGLHTSRVLVHQLLHNKVVVPEPVDTVLCVGSGNPLVDKGFTRRAALHAIASQQMFHAVSLAKAGTGTACQGGRSPDRVKQRCSGPPVSSLCVHSADVLVLTKECLLHPHDCVTAAQRADPKLEVFSTVDPGLNILPGSELPR